MWKQNWWRAWVGLSTGVYSSYKSKTFKHICVDITFFWLNCHKILTQIITCVFIFSFFYMFMYTYYTYIYIYTYLYERELYTFHMLSNIKLSRQEWCLAIDLEIQSSSYPHVNCSSNDIFFLNWNQQIGIFLNWKSPTSHV